MSRFASAVPRALCLKTVACIFFAITLLLVWSFPSVLEGTSSVQQKVFVVNSNTDETIPELYAAAQNTTNTPSPPWHILQYGKFRSASTFQFQLLCTCLFVKLLEGKDSSDSLAVQNYSCSYGQLNFDKAAPSVIKTHWLPKSWADEDVWVFATAKNDAKIVIEQLKAKGYNIKYVQEVQSLSRLGHFVTYKYQSIFDLTEEQTEQILEYMRYWEILRKCCGLQMSDDWRWELLPPHIKKERTYAAHHGKNSPSYPACEMYDISKVEMLLLNTSIARAMTAFPKIRDIIKPSLDDGVLDGTYCSRYNKAVHEHGLGFNQHLEEKLTAKSRCFAQEHTHGANPKIFRGEGGC